MLELKRDLAMTRLLTIYVTNSDGTGLTKLTNHPSGPLGGEPPLADAFPAWRP
jgi:hypothetical protein